MSQRKGCFYLLGIFFVLSVILFAFYEYNAPIYPKGRQTVRQVSHDGRFQLDGGDPLFILQDVKYVFAEYSAVGVPPVRQGVPFVRRGVPLAIFR